MTDQPMPARAVRVGDVVSMPGLVTGSRIAGRVVARTLHEDTSVSLSVRQAAGDPPAVVAFQLDEVVHVHEVEHEDDPAAALYDRMMLGNPDDPPARLSGVHDGWFADRVIPQPATDAGARAHATHWWARAWGFSQLVDHLAATGEGDNRALAQAVSSFVGAVRVAALLDTLAGIDATWDVTWGAEAAASMIHRVENPETLDHDIVSRLIDAGVDPDGIRRYRYPGEVGNVPPPEPRLAVVPDPPEGDR